MIEDPTLLLSYLREQLYETEVNRTMNMMIIGPRQHGKTRMLDCILGDPDTIIRNDGKFSKRFIMFQIRNKSLVYQDIKIFHAEPMFRVFVKLINYFMKVYVGRLCIDKLINKFCKL